MIDACRSVDCCCEIDVRIKYKFRMKKVRIFLKILDVYMHRMHFKYRVKYNKPNRVLLLWLKIIGD